MRITFDAALKGRSVIDARGRVIGEIDECVVDTGSWRVVSVRVKLRKEVADDLGIHRSVLRAGGLEVPTEAVQSTGDTLVLNRDVETLVGQAPEAPGPTATP